MTTDGAAAADVMGAEPGEDPRYDLGVLVVHGIGEQRQGQTLVGYADAIRDVLHRFATRDGDAEEQLRYRLRRQLSDLEKEKLPRKDKRERRKRLVDAQHQRDPEDQPVWFDDGVLKPGSDNPPALSLHLPGGRWCLAESWWAEQFDAPPARSLLWWSLTQAPRIVVQQLGRHLWLSWLKVQTARRGMPRLRAVLSRICWTVVDVVWYMVLLNVLTVALAVLWLLTLLPIPAFSAVVDKVATRMAAILGDSFVLVTSDAQYSAMVSRVRRDLAWLDERCAAVAVIAHSQGAFLAVDAIQTTRSRNLRVLFTVGAGLTKLHELRDSRAGKRRWTGWAIVLMVIYEVVMVFLTYPYVLSELADSNWISALLILLVPGFILLSPAALIWAIATESAHDERRLRKKLRLRPTGEPAPAWLDFVASMDPVPGGRIFAEDPDWLRTVPVVNKASILTDHTNYRQNVESVIAPILGELLQHCPPQLRYRLPTLDQERIDQARVRRNWRMSWLVKCRWLTGLAVLVVGLRLREQLDQLARGQVGPDVLIRPVAQTIGSVQPLWDAIGLHRNVVGPIVAVVVAVVVAYLPFLVLWRAWEKRDCNRLFRGEPVDSGGGIATLASALAAAYLLVAVPFMLPGAVRLPHPLTLSLASLALLFTLVGLLSGPASSSEPPPPYASRFGSQWPAATLLAAAVIVASNVGRHLIDWDVGSSGVIAVAAIVLLPFAGSAVVWALLRATSSVHRQLVARVVERSIRPDGNRPPAAGQLMLEWPEPGPGTEA
ncbi:hypothetical protein [Pseudonocardia charpentierae]|uniref:Uncharacterized protein n=1 Tax=Pseudonocardia charpentierae TaxID=3075545 RepID=A0ABU2NJA8_9PSEU|nr:hypothetical protein [Pseudonocardia sp. DSM 45834]MDT0354062.1 hypothetical protein [Pseudonocardia sp. DSM 45834]